MKEARIRHRVFAGSSLGTFLVSCEREREREREMYLLSQQDTRGGGITHQALIRKEDLTITWHWLTLTRY